MNRMKDNEKLFLQYSNRSIREFKKNIINEKKKNDKNFSASNFNRNFLNEKRNHFIENEIKILNKKIKNIKIELDNLKKSRKFFPSNLKGN